MRELPAFGLPLALLAGRRGLDAGELARSTDTADAVITSVLDGGEPDPSLLRRLGPALGLHRSDLFVIAGQPVPDNLTPLDATASSTLGSLAWSLTYLPGAVPELHQLVRAMPQQPRPAPPQPEPPRHRRLRGPGGLVVRLLHNRNLGLPGSAKYLFGIGKGPMLSASTIGLIGGAEKTLTPELLAGFAAFIDIPRDDLSALTGIDLTGVDQPAHPDAAEAAELIWSARRLTADQLRQVDHHAHAIRHLRTKQLDPLLRCNCPNPA
ncbi:XRE family transcriptional regulator [Solwaraspora sp. WMMD791]|uniref:XRE family transcriptional regulator n=1 Tax=Solwaraspora sp. WMMD791 TaxID=3016086 RepID=UPI00249C3B17|nr:XRE family transcriptional regulator [Solwaraspora sp. WMMD791]WFE29315.1 XRE family transcriptional regulator [Solwaraspora sp. WMMD791]